MSKVQRCDLEQQVHEKQVVWVGVWPCVRGEGGQQAYLETALEVSWPGL